MENFFALSNPVFWFTIGVVLIVFEVAAIQGMGLLFAGLGAITLGGLINFNIINDASNAALIAYFFLFTIIWAAILWKPLKNLLHKKHGEKYNDIVGTEATIDDETGLQAGKTGNVKWSGARMRAKIVEGSTTQIIDYKTPVYIHKKADGILYVDITKSIIR
jgi:membrane protein implicated in regulation of membrane protease activity